MSKLATKVVTKEMLISLGLDESQIAVSKFPVCKIGENVYECKCLAFDSLEEFVKTDFFNDIKNAGVLVISEQNTMIDSYVIKDDDRYIIRIFG